MTTFSVGSVLTTGLRMFLRTLLRMLPVVVVLHAPLLYLLLELHRAEDHSVEQLKAIVRVKDWLSLILLVDIPVSTIAAHAVVHDLRGTHTPMMASIATGLRRTLPAAGVMLLLYAVVFAVTTAFKSMLSTVTQLDHGGSISWIFVVGFFALLIALYGRWFVVVPAIVLERPSIVGALRRSAELTRGHRLRIGTIIVTVAVAFAALLAAIIARTSTGWDSDNPAYWYTSAVFKPWMVTGTTLLCIVFNLFRGVLCATAYHVLQTEAKMRSPATLANVFG